MQSRWSESDNYFVDGSLKVYSVVDLSSSEPLKLMSEENMIFDGPKGDDFKTLLLDNGFRVNRQGKTIVRVPKRNDEEDYNFFLLQMVVPLGPYGFANVPSSPTQEVKVLKSLLEETKADLAKKNATVDELQRQILDWKLTVDAMTESMKKVFFVDVDDLKQPPPPPPPPPPVVSTSGGDPLLSQYCTAKQEAKVLESLLDEIRQEVKESKSLVEETRTDLAKKNAEDDELHRKILESNSEQLRLIIELKSLI